MAGGAGAGGAEVVAYATVSGAVGALAPSPPRDDRDFFAHLEMPCAGTARRRAAPPPPPRSYAPAKDVADGHLARSSPPADARRRVAADLDRTPADVAKSEDARSQVPCLAPPLLLSIPPELCLAHPRMDRR